MGMHDIPLPKSQSIEPAKEWMTVEATAYTADCKGCIGITKAGSDVRNTIYHKNGMRIIATDPSVIPLGSIVEIEGFDELFVADDIGGAIKGNRIDILMSTKDEAFKWGRRQVKVRVVEERNIKEFEKCISGNANNVIGKVIIQK